MKRAIPENIFQQLEIAQNVCGALASISSGYGTNHKFTLDGRFVGDVGELLAVQQFAIQLHKRQQRRHDADCMVEGQKHEVQIKCRRASTVIDFYTQPELLLVIVLDEDWKHWEVIYNGTGEILTAKPGCSVDEKGRLKCGDKKGRRLNLDELREFSARQPPSALRVPERPTN